jgi:hypothetical protein
VLTAGWAGAFLSLLVPRIRHEAPIHHENVTKEADVRVAAPRLGSWHANVYVRPDGIVFCTNYNAGLISAQYQG